jgi:dihydrodipicolinate synthase/N-acetylneuraminate lyase
MNFKSFADKVVGGTPFVGLLRYAFFGQDEDKRKGVSRGRIMAKTLLHLANACVTPTLLACYALGVYGSGEYLPSRQRAFYQAIQQEKIDEQKRYVEAWNNFCGLADRNGDCTITLSEMEEAYGAAGVGATNIMPGDRLPSLTRGQLETACSNLSHALPEAK